MPQIAYPFEDHSAGDNLLPIRGANLEITDEGGMRTGMCLLQILRQKWAARRFIHSSCCITQGRYRRRFASGA